MSRVSTVLATSTILALAGGAGLAFAVVPEVLAKSRAGLWELAGIEGSKAPARVCVTDLADLARLQHSGRKCTQRAIRETGSSVTFSYQCTASDFGQSRLDWVTSQSFRIQTQGISGGLPFSYLVQARRLGDCEVKDSPAGH
ncbi:MAG: DUF3617 family protein [Sphingomicrobium sp.]